MVTPSNFFAVLSLKEARGLDLRGQQPSAEPTQWRPLAARVWEISRTQRVPKPVRAPPGPVPYSAHSAAGGSQRKHPMTKKDRSEPS